MQVLTALLCTYFHPSAEAAPRLGQCLSVFFPAFAALSVASQRLLSAAAIPAARCATSTTPAGLPVSKAPTPRLLRYLSQLLQACTIFVGFDGLRSADCNGL